MSKFHWFHCWHTVEIKEEEIATKHGPFAPKQTLPTNMGKDICCECGKTRIYQYVGTRLRSTLRS